MQRRFIGKEKIYVFFPKSIYFFDNIKGEDRGEDRSLCEGISHMTQYNVCFPESHLFKD